MRDLVETRTWQTVLRSRTEPLFEGEREREGGGGDKERA